jgi:hypothetical protein
MILNFYSDAGHGWVGVKRDLINKLGIADKISGYSYQKNDKVYLEEDCDAGLLLDALKAANIDYRIVTIRSNRSRIRDFNSFVNN